MRKSVCLSLLFLPAWAAGAVYLNQQDALELAFPPSTLIDRRTLTLSAQQKKDAESAAQARIDSRTVTYYVGRRGEDLQGYVFFQTDIVRTMPATYMVVLDPAGQLRFVELLAFEEPDDYRPPQKWLDQFKGKELAPSLKVKRGIRNITGATLTTQAITDGVRRVLAVAPYVVEEERKNQPK